MARHNIWILVLLAILGVVWLAAADSTEPALPTDSSGIVVADYDPTDTEWIDDLREPRIARFVVSERRDDAHVGVESQHAVAEVRSLGRLSPIDERQLSRDMEIAHRAVLDQLDRFSAERDEGMSERDALEHAVEEYRLLLMAKHHEAVVEASNAGRYWTFTRESDDAHQIRSPRGYLLTRHYGFETAQGETIDVVFAISLKHPTVAGVHRAYRDMRRIRVDYDAEAFNRRPYAERSAAIAAHDLAVSEIRRLRAEKLSPEQRTARSAAAVEKMISNDFRIDRQLCLLTAARR